MTANVSRAISAGLEPFRARIPLTGVQWADDYFYLSPESSGTEGKWKSYPYQIGPLNWMTSDDIEEFNWQKSRRIGYTKCLLAAAGSLIDQKNRNIAIWQPTDSDAKDFTTDEIDPMLRDVPVLGKKLKCEVGAKSKFNTVEKKVFHGATLDIKGGKTPRNYRRMTKDVGIYDELSAFDLDIGGEGSATEIGDGRLDQAPFPKSIRGSTPKIKGLCQIEAAVEKSDRIFYRFVECPHCGELQRLEFANMKWDDDDPETVRFICVKNKCEIFYRDFPKMDAAGRWQTLDGYCYDDEKDQFFDPEGSKIDKPKRIGARIWAAYSYLRPWSYFAYKWITASREAKNGNVVALKSVINTLLGETYEEKGESVDDKAINDRGEDYLAEGFIPNEVLVITVGVDLQGGANARVELEIVGHGLESETWSLDYQILKGDFEWPAMKEHLDEQLMRKFVREDGVPLKIAAAFIDSGYLSTEVYKFTAPRRKRRVYATKGVLTGMLCNKGTWQGDKKKGVRAILRTVNVDDAKTIIFNRLRIKKPGPGFCHFPDHYPDRYFKQLTNEEKKPKRRKGVVVGHEWVKKGPNEPLDCRAYALGALEYLNVNFGKLKLRLERQRDAIRARAKQEVEAPKSEAYTQKMLKNRRRTKGGFVNGWRR